MAQGRANVESVDVIRDFRNRLSVFDSTCRNALTGIQTEVKGVGAWLRTEQRTYWRRQLRKREEDLNRAIQELSQAQWSSQTMGEQSDFVDQKRAVAKARVRKEEAEKKAATVKKWSNLLDQKVDKLLRPCKSLFILLDQMTPRALSRLDQMMKHLEEYFRNAPPEKS